MDTNKLENRRVKQTLTPYKDLQKTFNRVGVYYDLTDGNYGNNITLGDSIVFIFNDKEDFVFLEEG